MSPTTLARRAGAALRAAAARSAARRAPAPPRAAMASAAAAAAATAAPPPPRAALAAAANATAHPLPAPAPPAGGASTLKLALCQLAVGGDKAANAAAAAAAVAAAAAAGARLVVLPEMWNCPYANASFPVYAEECPGVGEPGALGAGDVDGGKSSSGAGSVALKKAPCFAALARAAAAARVTLVGGSIPERDPTTGALYNTAFVFGPDGALLARHRKAHLFDIDIPGKITFRESDTLMAGGAATVVDTPAGRIGAWLFGVVGVEAGWRFVGCLLGLLFIILHSQSSAPLRSPPTSYPPTFHPAFHPLSSRRPRHLL
jgi:omega-amidase